MALHIRTATTEKVGNTIPMAQVEENAYFDTAELNYGASTHVSLINYSMYNVFVKSANGLIKTIKPAPNSMWAKLYRKSAGEHSSHLLIQTRSVMSTYDIACNHEMLVNSVSSGNYDPEQRMLAKEFNRAIAHGMEFGTRPTYGSVGEGSNGLAIPHLPKNVAAHASLGFSDHVNTLADDIRNGAVRCFNSQYRLNLDVFAENSSPVYVPGHDLLVAYGDSGLKHLQRTPHPRSNEYYNRLATEVARCHQDEVIVESINKFINDSSCSKYEHRPEIYGERTGVNRFMYSVEIIDNAEGSSYGTLWCHMFGSVVPIHPFSRKGVPSGIYVTTTVPDPMAPTRPIVTCTRYTDIEEIENIRLYKTMHEAKSSAEFRANAEMEYKQRDAEIKLMEQESRVMSLQATIVTNEQKNELEKSKILAERRKHEYEAERLNDELRKLELEREKVLRDMQRAKLAHERELEKMQLEREAMFAKHKADREHDARRLKAEQAKAKHEQESIKAKAKAESRSFLYKFISDTIKYAPNILKFGATLVKKFKLGTLMDFEVAK